MDTPVQSTPHKQCPHCFQLAPLRTERCTVCGHQLRVRVVPPPPPPPAPKPLDAWCVVSLVLALLSVLALALPLGISAVVVGVIGLERGRRGKTFAWWGVGIGLVAAVYGLWTSGLRWFGP